MREYIDFYIILYVYTNSCTRMTCQPGQEQIETTAMIVSNSTWYRFIFRIWFYALMRIQCVSAYGIIIIVFDNVLLLYLYSPKHVFMVDEMQEFPTDKYELNKFHKKSNHKHDVKNRKKLTRKYPIQWMTSNNKINLTATSKNLVVVLKLSMFVSFSEIMWTNTYCLFSSHRELDSEVVCCPQQMRLSLAFHSYCRPNEIYSMHFQNKIEIKIKTTENISSLFSLFVSIDSFKILPLQRISRFVRRAAYFAIFFFLLFAAVNQIYFFFFLRGNYYFFVIFFPFGYPFQMFFL